MILKISIDTKFNIIFSFLIVNKKEVYKINVFLFKKILTKQKFKDLFNKKLN